jgi:hypothetical protein
LTVQVGNFKPLSTTGFLADKVTAETVLISSPLTLNFDVVRNTLASANRGTFRIYNLAPETRRQIFHDRNQTQDYKQIKLQAGYEGQSPLPTIFQGNQVQAYSWREGTNWVTEIEAFDGGYGILNGQVAQTVPAGWDIRALIKSVFQTLPRTGIGAIGDVESGSSRGVTLMGNSWDLATQMATGQNAQVFVDNEQANFLKRNEYLAGPAGLSVISNDTGLLETPRRSNALLEVTLLFEPRLQVGQHVLVEGLEKVYNGEYKVLGVAHRGVISGAVSGSATTTVSLDLGTGVLQAVARAA